MILILFIIVCVIIWLSSVLIFSDQGRGDIHRAKMQHDEEYRKAYIQNLRDPKCEKGCTDAEKTDK